MRLFVAVTDNDWFALHASKATVEEVNFWRPSEASFKVLQPGELLLFKLKSPNDAIPLPLRPSEPLEIPISIPDRGFVQPANYGNALRDSRNPL